MIVERGTRLVIFAAIAGAIVILDQLTKQILAASIPLHRGVELIPGFLDLVHTRNPGAAFGLWSASGGTGRAIFLMAASVVALVLILWLTFSTEDLDWPLLIACAVFFGGALGNLIDRIQYGEVIDFLDVHAGDLHWPAFNVADSALTVGAAIFILHFVLSRKPTGEPSQNL